MTLLDKEYDSEELADVERDIYESLDNDLIVVDTNGFSKGVYKVIIEYEENI